MIFCDLILCVLSYLSLCHFTFKSLKPEITNCPTKLPPWVSPALQEAPQVVMTQVRCLKSSETSLCSPRYRWSASRCCCCVSLCGFVFLHLLGHTPAQWLSNCGPGALGNPQESFRVLWAYFTFSHKCTVEFWEATCGVML